jgi:hypothetical protein
VLSKVAHHLQTRTARPILLEEQAYGPTHFLVGIELEPLPLVDVSDRRPKPEPALPRKMTFRSTCSCSRRAVCRRSQAVEQIVVGEALVVNHRSEFSAVLSPRVPSDSGFAVVDVIG